MDNANMMYNCAHSNYMKGWNSTSEQIWKNMEKIKPYSYPDIFSILT